MKSMTGYGKGEASNTTRKIIVELKSVNNRFLEINSRFPKALSFVEDTVKKQVQETIKRGSVDVVYSYELTGETDKKVKLDLALAGEYLSAGKTLAQEYSVANDLTASVIMRMPDVLSLASAEADREEMKTLFAQATKNAVADLDKMRVIEGEGVKADFKKLVGNIETALGEVKKRAPQIVKDYHEKITRRVNELLGGVDIDPSRIAMEVAVFADKCDVNEEISRLGSHIEQFYTVLEADEPQGRKLDFLSQEMNREINTMGSKANDLELTELVLTMKNELEKIKEQIRNVE